MSKIRHHIRPDLLAPAAAIAVKFGFGSQPSANRTSSHFCTSLNLPLMGKLSSLPAELAENTTYK